MKSKLKSAVAVATLIATGTAASAVELRLSHQWSNNDVRHKVAQIVADEVAAADVALLMKRRALVYYLRRLTHVLFIY